MIDIKKQASNQSEADAGMYTVINNLPEPGNQMIISDPTATVQVGLDEKGRGYVIINSCFPRSTNLPGMKVVAWLTAEDLWAMAIQLELALSHELAGKYYE